MLKKFHKSCKSFSKVDKKFLKKLKKSKKFLKNLKKKYKKNKIKNLIFDEKIKKIMSHLRHRTIYFFKKKLCPICATVDFIKNRPGGPFL